MPISPASPPPSTPTRKVERSPWVNWANTSWPKVVVPNQQRADGGHDQEPGDHDQPGHQLAVAAGEVEDLAAAPGPGGWPGHGRGGRAGGRRRGGRGQLLLEVGVAAHAVSPRIPVRVRGSITTYTMSIRKLAASTPMT